MVGGGDGVELAVALVLTLSAVRKNGRMVSPETEANSFEEGGKSMAVMVLDYCDGSPPRILRRPRRSALEPQPIIRDLFQKINFRSLISYI